MCFWYYLKTIRSELSLFIAIVYSLLCPYICINVLNQLIINLKFFIMKKLNLFFVMALALVTTAAFAQSNESLVEQNGAENAANVDQSGSHNESTIDQSNYGWSLFSDGNFAE